MAEALAEEGSTSTIYRQITVDIVNYHMIAMPGSGKGGDNNEDGADVDSDTRAVEVQARCLEDSGLHGKWVYSISAGARIQEEGGLSDGESA